MYANSRGMASIHFDIVIDSSNATSSVESLSGVIKRTADKLDEIGKKNGFKDMGETVKYLNDDLGGTGVKVKALVDETEELTAQNSNLKQILKETRKEYEDQAKAAKEAEDRYLDALNKREAAEERLNRMKENYGDSYGQKGLIFSAEKQYEKANKRVEETKKALEDAEKEQDILNQKVQEYEQILDKPVEKQKSIRTQLRLAREEMTRMIDAGKTGTPEFQALAQHAGTLRRQFALASAEMRYFADPNRHLTTLKTGLQGVAGAAGLVTGAMGLFNSKSEKMAAIQTKIQSILAVVVGLETTYNMLKKTSNIMMAIEEVKTWAIAKARGVQAAATTAATVAQEGLNASMKANPIGAVISLLAVLGTAIYTVVKAIGTQTDAEKKAREEREAHIKAMKEQREQWMKTVADTAGKEISTYKSLRKEWNALGDDMKAKEKFVKDNQDAFHSLGFAINGVSDAEKLLVQNTDQVVAAIMARAKAAAYQELATEEIKKQVKTMLESDSVKGGKFHNVFREGQKLSADQYKNFLDQYGIKRTANVRGDVILSKNQAELLNKGSKDFAKRQREAVNKKIEESNQNLKKLEDFQTKELEESKKQLQAAGIKEYQEGAKSTTKSGGGQREVLKSYQELTDEALKIQKDRIDAEIGAEEEYTQRWESLQRKRIAIQEELSEREANKTKENALKELDKSYKGGKSGMSETQYQEHRLQIEQDTDAQILALRAKAEKEQEAIIKKRMEREEERAKKEKQNLNEFLKEYGSIEQQRLAIAQEYEEKIAAETDPNKRAKLTLDKEAAMKEFETKQLNESIDWAGVFSDLQGHTKEYLEGLRDQLQGLLNQGNLPIDQMAIIQEKLQAVNAEISKQGGLFDFVGDRQREHNRLVQEAADAQKRLTESKKEEADAEVDLRAAQEEIAQMLRDQGKDASVPFDESLLKGMDETSEEYKAMVKLLEVLRVSEGRLENARKKTNKATNEAANAENKAKRNAATAVADWFSDAQQFISEKGLDQLPALFDSIGLGGVSDKLSKGLSGFNNAAGAAADFASGNYIGAAVKTIGAIKDFGSALGIGGGNASEVARTTAKLTEVNEKLADRIDDLKDVIGDSAGDRSRYAYEQALKAQEEINSNTMEILKAQMGYHNAHHSNEYYMDDREIARYNSAAQNAFRAAGVNASTINGLTSIYNLTPEQLKAIKDFAPDLWKYLTETGKYDKSEYWENVVANAGKASELTEKMQQNLTQTSWSSLRDGFLSTLTDMESSSEDFAKSFEDMMFKALVNTHVLNDSFDKWLKGWYADYSKALETANYAELERLEQEYTQKREEVKQQSDAIAKATGYTGGSYSQQGSQKGFATMSQDTANELNGRFTALQIAGESINAQMIYAVESLNNLANISASSNSSVVEMRNMMIMTNSYLEDMVKYAKLTYNDFGEKLDTIALNTR